MDEEWLLKCIGELYSLYLYLLWYINFDKWSNTTIFVYSIMFILDSQLIKLMIILLVKFLFQNLFIIILK